MANSRYEYVKSFEVHDGLLPSTWIVIRIDGCHFHRFSDVHEFEKPNDENALKLMNSCALAMFEEFPDIVFAYGVSDEYSFVLKKSSKFYERRSSKILSLSVSFFSSTYVMKWKDYFPEKPLKYTPYFDGRVICYPSEEILRDYLSWRQVDCHINNQYNTCFWMLVDSGKSKREAQDILKGTQTAEKNELLYQKFGINYNKIPAIFRKGSCIYREMVSISSSSIVLMFLAVQEHVFYSISVDEIVKYNEAGTPIRRPRKKVVLDHCDIIGPEFWNEHPTILLDK
ncbi:tRNA(His) guanylyltransferase 2 [Nymphaea thermarum]|nr:tRNA(His) guanylyltransferase 2 [Nymphaea thermarum]